MLLVKDASVAVAWYKRLGFTTEWVHRFEPDFPAFVSISLGGAGTRVFLSEHMGDASGPGYVWIRVPDIGPIAAEFGVAPQPSGGRVEVALVDPDGNRVTVGAVGDPAQRPAEEYGYTLD